MKKMILLLSFAFICQNQLFAQKTTVPAPTYDITVTRSDLYAENVPGHAHAGVVLDIKIGSTVSTSTPSFPPDISSSRIFTFPITASLPGFPPPTRYAKVTFTYPSILYSGYYPLTTVVGDHTTIPADTSTMTNYAGQYGYGVDLYCIAPNQYVMRIARFECFWCVGGGPISKSIRLNDTSLVPNPSLGFSELFYTAKDRETISVNVTDLNGKTVRAYTTDIQAGLNKLPIDIQNNPGGQYIVQWKSNNGTTGTLKLIKK